MSNNSSNTAIKHSYNFSNVHILAAEDSLINQLIITQMLGVLGCSVEIVENGKEAISKLKNNHYDLILMDCIMPEMDGYKATEIIRQMAENKKRNIPIIALSATIEKDANKKFLAAGMNDYLSKPLKRDELQATLEKWLNESKVIDNINNKESIKQEFFQTTATEILNQKNIQDFHDLMGDRTSEILDKYCDIAQNYIHAISQSVDKKNFNTASDFAHQLKSSSAQIGASEVSKLAESIEKISRKEKPNLFILEDLIKNLKEQQQIVADYIHNNFPVIQST